MESRYLIKSRDSEIFGVLLGVVVIVALARLTLRVWWRGRVDTDVDYVVAADEDIAVVGDQTVMVVLLRALEHDVHVSVDPRHLPPVLAVPLEVDRYVAPDALDEYIKRLLARLHSFYTLGDS